MSNFSPDIFQSLPLRLSESHNNGIKTNDIIAFKFVSKLNATVLFFNKCEETEDCLVIYVIVCFARQMLRWLDPSHGQMFCSSYATCTND
jgi:hypothetical protein